MSNRSSLARLTAAMRERLSHNRGYMTQPYTTRAHNSALSYGRAKSREWLEGEQAAIEAENQWIEALLKEFAP